MTQKWGDPQLDAAEFAMDKFFDALAVVTEARGKIWDAKRAGTATPEDEVRMRDLQAQWIAIMHEIGDVQQRLISGDHALQPKMN
jgi:hypothetical protein